MKIVASNTMAIPRAACFPLKLRVGNARTRGRYDVPARVAGIGKVYYG
jgi:hypothetical protein